MMSLFSTLIGEHKKKIVTVYLTKQELENLMISLHF